MTNTPNNSRVENAINAACEVAKQQGLKFNQAIALQDRSNLVIHLYPTPVVARIATTTGTVRFGDTWFAKEVAIASYLASVEAPVVPPTDVIEPGPHQYNGLVLSFWQFVEELEPAPDPTIVGRALRECHEALVDFEAEITAFDPVHESESLMFQLISQGAFSPSDAEVLQKINHKLKTTINQLSLPMQPLHGDANFSNVLNTTQGVLWTDWEDTFVGYIGWDIACLIASSRVFGTEIASANAALVGYGLAINEELLDFFIEARTFQTAVWNFIIGQQHPQSLAHLEGKLRWFRARFRNI